ncbi:hypothetical protein EDF70_10558 [Neorhizobium sp. JUb45]|nr:hypothetical protein EDF70_10558 [Neorhizobium sp. JUb45]
MFSTPRALVLVAIIVIISVIVFAIYRAGGDSVRTSTERQNNAAASRADQGALDYDACRDAGRLWDFRAGRCGRTSTDSRD